MAAVRWALEPISSERSGPMKVLDLAAGTGKLTGVLCAEGHNVTAVEPDEAMLGELVRLHGGVRALPGTAERIPLPDGTVDAVVAGQAFHWFDYERAMTEIARVLRPGGVVAGLWNADDPSVEWVVEFGQVSMSPVSAKDFPATNFMPDHPLFTGGGQTEFPHSQRRTAETLMATVRTTSHMLISTPEEQDETVKRMREFLSARPETAAGEFDFPIRTYVKRLVRL